MRAIVLFATLALVAAPLALAPAGAVDLCDKFGVCVPPYQPVQGCHFNLVLLRGDLPTEGCAPTATAYVCDVDYFGGSPGGPLGNIRLSCQPVATLP